MNDLILMNQPNDAARASIVRMLDEYNVERTQVPDEQALDVMVVDPETQAVVGGMIGRTSLGVFFINYFCLPAHLRGKGVGANILTMAETEAVRRGCSTALLFTMAIQAPSFYEKYGYEVFGRVDCNPPGNARIFMRKRLPAIRDEK